MTTGRINQVTIFQAPAPGDTRSRPRRAPRLAGRSRAERFSIETRPTRGGPASAVLCGAPPPAPSPEGPQRARKAPSLEARLCEFLPGRSSDPKGDSPRRGEERVPHPGGRKPFPQADPQRRRFPTAPRSPSVHWDDGRPGRISSLLDITLAQRVSVQAPHPRRRILPRGKGPPTARAPRGAPAASDLDIPAGKSTEPVAAKARGARGAGLGPAESSVAHRAPGARALRARERGRVGRQPHCRARCLLDESPRGRPPGPGPRRRVPDVAFLKRYAHWTGERGRIPRYKTAPRGGRFLYGEGNF